MFNFKRNKQLHVHFAGHIQAPERNIENLQLVWSAAKETAETEGMGFMPRVMFHQACNEYFLSLCAK